jgi:uncharacterized protein YndB with AHSA1/START domain
MDNEIVVTRVFDAPRSRVFKAWTDPERMKQWWGPNGFTMNPDWPAEALITVTFAEHDGKTTFTLRHAVGSAPAADRDGCQAGWSESLDRLDGYLEEARR